VREALRAFHFPISLLEMCLYHSCTRSTRGGLWFSREKRRKRCLLSSVLAGCGHPKTPDCGLGRASHRSSKPSARSSALVARACASRCCKRKVFAWRINSLSPLAIALLVLRVWFPRGECGGGGAGGEGRITWKEDCEQASGGGVRYVDNS